MTKTEQIENYGFHNDGLIIFVWMLCMYQITNENEKLNNKRISTKKNLPVRT